MARGCYLCFAWICNWVVDWLSLFIATTSALSVYLATVWIAQSWNTNYYWV